MPAGNKAVAAVSGDHVESQNSHPTCTSKECPPQVPAEARWAAWSSAPTCYEVLPPLPLPSPLRKSQLKEV